MRANALPMAAALAALALAAAESGAAGVGGTAEDSVLAVVTHKGGIAGGLAHEHLVVARQVEGELEFSPAAPLATRFRAVIAADELAVGDPEAQRLWYPRLAELGVVSEPFSELSSGDLAKIRKAMLGRDQLAAEAHPTIEVRLVDVAAAPGESGSTHRVRVALTVRGVTVERELAAWMAASGTGGHRLEALGTFDFTEFGIEPYSALLGAVKVTDTFHLYASLTTPAAEAEGGAVEGAR